MNNNNSFQNVQTISLLAVSLAVVIYWSHWVEYKSRVISR